MVKDEHEHDECGDFADKLVDEYELTAGECIEANQIAVIGTHEIVRDLSRDEYEALCRRQGCDHYTLSQYLYRVAVAEIIERKKGDKGLYDKILDACLELAFAVTPAGGQAALYAESKAEEYAALIFHTVESDTVRRFGDRRSL